MTAKGLTNKWFPQISFILSQSYASQKVLPCLSCVVLKNWKTPLSNFEIIEYFYRLLWKNFYQAPFSRVKFYFGVKIQIFGLRYVLHGNAGLHWYWSGMAEFCWKRVRKNCFAALLCIHLKTMDDNVLWQEELCCLCLQRKLPTNIS